MRLISKLFLIIIIFSNFNITNVMATPSIGGAAETNLCDTLKPELHIKITTAKQGDFFYVLASGLKTAPKLWFNSREFEMFEIASGHIPACKEIKTYRAFIPVENLTKPGPYAILARAGEWEEKIPVTVKDNAKPVSRIWTKGPDIIPTERELNLIGSALGSKSSDKKWQGKFGYPSQSAKSSPFGVKRSYNGKPVDSYHKGLDFAAGTGSPVLAPANGKVILTGEVKDGFKLHGNTVMLDHGQGITTIYMHLSKICVKQGDIVTKGTKLGEVGSTGIATGPHLHWGLYLYGTSTEPENFVKEEWI